MSKYAVILSVAVFCLAAFEVQQVVAACKCMCYAVSGLPANVDVDDSGICDEEFQYTYKVHFATNDECPSGLGGSAFAYTSSPSINIDPNNHDISPDSFTINGAGHTETFTVSGKLDCSTQDGVSASYVKSNDVGVGCLADSDETSVDILHDDTDCTEQCN